MGISRSQSVVALMRLLESACDYRAMPTHRPSGRIARIDATPANAHDVFRHPFAYERSAA
jgi:hypothetical protein